MEPQTFYLWRDALDKDYYMIGKKIVACPSGKERYQGWGQVFGDGISEMFGADVYEMCRAAKAGEPIEVTVVRIKQHDNNECQPAD